MTELVYEKLEEIPEAFSRGLDGIPDVAICWIYGIMCA